MFRKILIANRGEIAVRIIRTCKRLGIKTVAIYSDPEFESKRLAKAAGVPVVQGANSEVQSAEEALTEARRIGFPVLLKAAFGGGGRGMRIARTATELKRGFETARSEANTGFGHPELYVEKFLQEPRHIEVQILAGPRGRVVHLGERECSLQRRYQKILEETPSPALDT